MTTTDTRRHDERGVANRGRPPREREEAEEFLIQLLTESPEGLPVKAIQAEAKDAGLAWRTVERAKARLGVTASRRGFGGDGGWWWKLPDKASTTQTPTTTEDTDRAEALRELAALVLIAEQAVKDVVDRFPRPRKPHTTSAALISEITTSWSMMLWRLRLDDAKTCLAEIRELLVRKRNDENKETQP